MTMSPGLSLGAAPLRILTTTSPTVARCTAKTEAETSTGILLRMLAQPIEIDAARIVAATFQRRHIARVALPA